MPTKETPIKYYAEITMGVHCIFTQYHAGAVEALRLATKNNHLECKREVNQVFPKFTDKPCALLQFRPIIVFLLPK